MRPTTGLSYTIAEQGYMSPQSTLLSPSGCFGTVASFTDTITPIPVGGFKWEDVRLSQSKSTHNN